MKFLILVAVCFAAVFTAEAKVKTILESDRENYDDVDYYDCTGRHETMETHPFDCTRFIKCHNGRAADMACPKCHVDAETCPNEYLHWDQPAQICNWGDQAGCSGLPPIPTTVAPPKPDPETTAAPPNKDECDDKCQEDGYCQSYRVCEGGRWANHTCDNETWWNPSVGPHGGACDFWDNLTDDLQEEYRDDPECHAPELPCYWREDENCANKYFWLDVGQKTNKSEVHLACPKSPLGVSLVWDQDSKQCKHCSPEESCKICP